MHRIYFTAYCSLGLLYCPVLSHMIDKFYCTNNWWLSRISWKIFYKISVYTRIVYKLYGVVDKFPSCPMFLEGEVQKWLRRSIVEFLDEFWSDRLNPCNRLFVQNLIRIRLQRSIFCPKLLLWHSKIFRLNTEICDSLFYWVYHVFITHV